ncbi:class I SAM-dependent methyltransferase [Frankia sp. Cpl3]|nr:class I SAM-dependent methyltransferase [Parafrankia colletiae]MCK9900762.1 class I SAM-dependent methyltransferase [Frankia sp. Cpl3]
MPRAIVGTVRQEEIWDVDTARRYDTPGAGMFAAEVVEPTVDRLAELAGEGRALEFAIGTGRVAVPLAERGVPVTGIELSRPMIDRLRAKVDEATIPVVIGDMATALAPGSYTLVYLVYNTISDLLTQPEQVACFRNAARHLVPDRAAPASARPAEPRRESALPHRRVRPPPRLPARRPDPRGAGGRGAPR